MAVAFLLVLALLVPLSFGCGGAGKGVKTIHIGELTDFTGTAAPALKTITYVTQDMIRYYNDENLIPGVRVKLEAYDTKWDTARVLLGYEWCKEKGVKVVINIEPSMALAVKSFAERDKIIIATMGALPQLFEPPGWVLGFSSATVWSANTLLQWVSEHQWDYDTQGIPKLGLVGWNDANSLITRDGVEEYLKNHPGKFDYVGGYITSVGTMSFTSEAKKLKDCDYVANISGSVTGPFLRDLRTVGSKARLIDCIGAMPSYLKLNVDMVGWEALDGSLTTSQSYNWTDSSPIVDLAKELLGRHRPSEAGEIIASGAGYVGPAFMMVGILEVLQQAVKNVGAENFNGQAYLDAALSYKTTSALWAGCPEFGFSQNKRWLIDYTLVNEFKADVQEIVTVSDWLPNVME
jgi:ABC-type branched-subunit amino acid transport system substrate-binding protein